MSTIMAGGEWGNGRKRRSKKELREEINRKGTETKLLRNVIKIVSAKAGAGGGSPR